MVLSPSFRQQFLDSPVALGRRMSRLGAAWRREVDQELRRSGLTEATWRPILMLGMLAPPLGQADLARALDIEGAFLVRLLDVLERHGLIERAADVRDRRSSLVAITDSGAGIYQQVYQAREAISSRLLAAVSAQQRTLCDTVFDRIEQVLVKPGEQAPAGSPDDARDPHRICRGRQLGWLAGQVGCDDGRAQPLYHGGRLSAQERQARARSKRHGCRTARLC